MEQTSNLSNVGSTPTEGVIFKILGRISKGDYMYVKVDNHPYMTKDNYVLEHRAVLELHLNRYLEKEELVHHINGSKKDNRLENLEIVCASGHAQRHRQKKMVELFCDYCGKPFLRRYNQVKTRFGGKYNTCSKKCSGKLSHTRVV